MCVNSLSQGLNVDLPKARLESQTSRSESRASTTRPRRHTNISVQPIPSNNFTPRDSAGNQNHDARWGYNPVGYQTLNPLCPLPISLPPPYSGTKVLANALTEYNDGREYRHIITQ
ncbi:hypothetical protein ElyMa_005775500 [Elysia marginata]|uniref:Uncharacterized protein n=1 Tax=Elysia marginata TaxID=1093978 RepID=A0AAV4FQK4_9GAST|nr:hypothetical protein ElyMa_005775500 [Elysia marginata]